MISLEPLGNGVEIYTSSHHGFGTDAVLLADFAAAKNNESAVDLGTGCGIIPLLLLRNVKLKEIVGVDISEEAIELAKKSAIKNNFDVFKPILADIKNLSGKTEFGKYNLVTCNPPYKKANAGIKNPDPIAAAARHEVLCNLEDIISTGSKLLQTGGRMCVCHRPERLCELFCLMSKYKIEPKKLRLVCQRKGEEPWLVLAEGKRCAKQGLKIMPDLYIEENGKFSEEMIKIYGAYKEAYL